MGADWSGCLLLLLLLMSGLSPEVAAEAQEPSDGPGASQEVVWLTDVPAAMEFIAATEVAVIGFFQIGSLDDEMTGTHSSIYIFPGAHKDIGENMFTPGHYLGLLHAEAWVLELEGLTNSIFMSNTSDLYAVEGGPLLITEIPVVSIFHSMVQKFQDVSFGISTDAEVLAHYNITGNAISLFRLVDNERLDLESEYIESIDATKLSRFIEINSLHLVTEYNPVTVIGLFNSLIQIHLLLMMNKASPEYEESINRYQKAAKLFQGKILFILVNSGVKANGKVISFFKLKESQLPALAIYQTVDEEWDALPIAEVSVEHVQNFCDGFLKGERLRENHEPEEKTLKAEL